MYNNYRYLAEDPSPLMSALGVLVNGVNLYGVGSPRGFSAHVLALPSMLML